MEIQILFFLTSGVFLGWALGANHLGNVFGTAIGSRMVTWIAAAIICSVFVTLGATISGSGAAHTLGKLGAINTISGSFIVALSAALTVYWMTKLGLPVSTTQAIVGGIVGWNFFSGSQTDTETLVHIMTGWVTGPLLAAFFAVLLYIVTTKIVRRVKPHLLRVDAYTRVGLIIAGAFGSYSLGANNIANVMGVFVPVSPFTDFQVADWFVFSSIHQLFLIGGLSIAVGVMTYSHKVVHTVGSGLFPMSPIAAWVVVMSHSLVLFLFASKGLEHFLASNGLPTIPLVPVSSSEVVIGAVLGIGIYKGGRGIRWNVLGHISLGWLCTPIITASVCFIGLYFMQNVFDQRVYIPIKYQVSPASITKLSEKGIDTNKLTPIKGLEYFSAYELIDALEALPNLSPSTHDQILSYTKEDLIMVDHDLFEKLAEDSFSVEQWKGLEVLSGTKFKHRWRFEEALSNSSEGWRLKEKRNSTKLYNNDINGKIDLLVREAKQNY